MRGWWFHPRVAKFQLCYEVAHILLRFSKCGGNVGDVMRVLPILPTVCQDLSNVHIIMIQVK